MTVEKKHFKCFCCNMKHVCKKITTFFFKKISIQTINFILLLLSTPFKYPTNLQEKEYIAFLHKNLQLTLDKVSSTRLKNTKQKY